MLVTLALAALADTCEHYEPPQSTNIGGVREASGLAVSRTRPGVIYTHEDKGSQPVITAIDAMDGTIVGEHLVRDAKNEDWEDIAAAPCPDEGACLYIGDIGDNDRSRASVVVYVIREPQEGDDRVRTIARWTAVYPDSARDAETLMVMPCSGRVHLVTKDGDGDSRVFRFPARVQGTVTLEQVGRLQVDGPVAEARQVTGGDWDVDGDRVAIRTSSEILEWTVDPERPNAHWTTPPTIVEGANELQGEALAYGLDGELWSATEGGLVISEFACPEQVASDHACDFPRAGLSGCGCTQQPGSPAWWLALPLALLGLRYRRMDTASPGAISSSSSSRTGTPYSG